MEKVDLTKIPTTIEEAEKMEAEIGELRFEDLPERLQKFPEMQIALWRKAAETIHQHFGESDPILVERKFLESLLATFAREVSNTESRPLRTQLALKTAQLEKAMEAVEHYAKCEWRCRYDGLAGHLHNSLCQYNTMYGGHGFKVARKCQAAIQAMENAE